MIDTDCLKMNLLIPHWLSLWELVGTIITIFASLLIMYLIMFYDFY